MIYILFAFKKKKKSFCLFCYKDFFLMRVFVLLALNKLFFNYFLGFLEPITVKNGGPCRPGLVAVGVSNCLVIFVARISRCWVNIWGSVCLSVFLVNLNHLALFH